MVVRWYDGGILQFIVTSSILFPFRMKLDNTNFLPTAGPTNWQAPPGPCPSHIGIFGEPDVSTFPPFSLEGLVQFFQRIHTAQGVLKGVFLDGSEIAKRSNEIKPDPLSKQPTPPKLHQYFSSDYILGWGLIEEKNDWKHPNDIFRGHVVVDKTVGGLYLEVSDNQNANVPWTFQTSFISHPFSSSNITGYMFLENGRCWSSQYVVVDPNFPLQIPADASYGGSHKIGNAVVELWSFPFTVQFAPVDVTVAVDVKDSSIVFLNLVASYAGAEGNSYFAFSGFNSTRPSQRNYAVPPGPCTPVQQ